MNTNETTAAVPMTPEEIATTLYADLKELDGPTRKAVIAKMEQFRTDDVLAEIENLKALLK